MRIQQKIITTEETITSNDKGEKIVRLGIQSAPGTQFCINGLKDDYISIGFTGIYEINFKDLGISVVSITVKPKELDQQTYNTIVDIIWE